MITTTSDRHPTESRFPTLRTLNATNPNSPTLILFTDDVTGTVVQGNGFLSVGYHSDKWNPEDFTDFHGSVTLTNT